MDETKNNQILGRSEEQTDGNESMKSQKCTGTNKGMECDLNKDAPVDMVENDLEIVREKQEGNRTTKSDSNNKETPRHENKTMQDRIDSDSTNEGKENTVYLPNLVKSIIQSSSSSDCERSGSEELETPCRNKPAQLKDSAYFQSQKDPLKEMVMKHKEDITKTIDKYQNEIKEQHITLMYQMREFQSKAHEEIASANTASRISIVEKMDKAIGAIDAREEGSKKWQHNHEVLTTNYFSEFQNTVVQSKAQFSEDIESLLLSVRGEITNIVAEERKKQNQEVINEIKKQLDVKVEVIRMELKDQVVNYVRGDLKSELTQDVKKELIQKFCTKSPLMTGQHLSTIHPITSGKINIEEGAAKSSVEDSSVNNSSLIRNNPHQNLAPVIAHNEKGAMATRPCSPPRSSNEIQDGGSTGDNKVHTSKKLGVSTDVAVEVAVMGISKEPSKGGKRLKNIGEDRRSKKVKESKKRSDLKKRRHLPQRKSPRRSKRIKQSALNQIDTTQILKSEPKPPEELEKYKSLKMTASLKSIQYIGTDSKKVDVTAVHELQSPAPSIGGDVHSITPDNEMAIPSQTILKDSNGTGKVAPISIGNIEAKKATIVKGSSHALLKRRRKKRSRTVPRELLIPGDFDDDGKCCFQSSGSMMEMAEGQISYRKKKQGEAFKVKNPPISGVTEWLTKRREALRLKPRNYKRKKTNELTLDPFEFR